MFHCCTDAGAKGAAQALTCRAALSTPADCAYAAASMSLFTSSAVHTLYSSYLSGAEAQTAAVIRSRHCCALWWQRQSTGLTLAHMHTERDISSVWTILLTCIGNADLRGGAPHLCAQCCTGCLAALSRRSAVAASRPLRTWDQCLLSRACAGPAWACTVNTIHMNHLRHAQNPSHAMRALSVLAHVLTATQYSCA